VHCHEVAVDLGNISSEARLALTVCPRDRYYRAIYMSCVLDRRGHVLISCTAPCDTGRVLVAVAVYHFVGTVIRVCIRVRILDCEHEGRRGVAGSCCALGHIQPWIAACAWAGGVLSGVQRHSSRAGQRAEMQGGTDARYGPLQCCASALQEWCTKGTAGSTHGCRPLLTTIGTNAQYTVHSDAGPALGHTAKWCSSMAEVKGDILRCRLAIPKATWRDRCTAVWHTWQQL
jgi:hypothetical protein